MFGLFKMPSIEQLLPMLRMMVAQHVKEPETLRIAGVILDDSFGGVRFDLTHGASETIEPDAVISGETLTHTVQIWVTTRRKEDKNLDAPP